MNDQSTFPQRYALKISSLLVCILLTASLKGQVYDDFSDGDFTDNPVWQGDELQFEVNSAKQLHLNASGADTSTLWVHSASLQNGEWDFWVKLSFNTSANNYARFYLASEGRDLTIPMKAYYIQIGGSTDSISLFKQDGSQHSKLLTASSCYTGNSTNFLRMKITYTPPGIWNLSIDPTGNHGFLEEGSILESFTFQPVWCGFMCKYTASNTTKFYLDDVYAGPLIVDTVAPQLQQIKVSSENHLALLFNEPLERKSVEPVENYRFRTNLLPVAAYPDSLDPTVVHLLFSDPFSDGWCDTLVISGVEDPSGNRVVPIKTYFCNYTAKQFDVIVDEIMADPDPMVGLPDVEYVELYNRTAFPIDLEGWEFQTMSTTKVFPSVLLPSHGYLILSKGEELGFYGQTLALFTSSSTLTNEGTTLTLRNREGRIIHALHYETEWYQTSLKEEGGWSLEMVDVENPCGCKENWSASTDPLGGTPGGRNAVTGFNPDSIAPTISRAYVLSTRLISLIFSESIDTTTWGSASGWQFINGENEVEHLDPQPPLYTELQVILRYPLEPATLYQLKLAPGVADCAHNQVDSSGMVVFALPESIDSNDVVINEVLPNPFVNGERFIELYNRSSKVIDLFDLIYLENDSTELEPTKPIEVSSQHHLFLPQSYLALTESADDIRWRYPYSKEGNIVQVETFPTLSDEEGTLILARKTDFQVVDQIHYSEKMQFPLLVSSEGVSLERISSERSSLDETNWHSAAQSAGFATPGLRNSQSQNIGLGTAQLTLQPERITPDNDGIDDVLNISLHLEEVGFTGSLFIFDDQGSLVRPIFQNQLVGSEEHFSWDGTTSRHEKVKPGIYLAYLELVSVKGGVIKQKRVIAVGF